MPNSSALPFYLRRSSDVYGKAEITSTIERIHGLLRLDGRTLVIQWRLARETQRYGFEIRTDREMEPVREVVIPLSAIAGAAVRGHWLWGFRIVLTASDLHAFEGIAGSVGLRLDHPATLELRVERKERLAALEFAAELNLAVAERTLDNATLGGPKPQDALEAPGSPVTEPIRNRTT